MARKPASASPAPDAGWKAWVTPAILVAIAVGGFSYLESRFSAVADRFASIDRRFDSIDRRFDTLAKEMAEQRARTDKIIAKQAEIGSELTIIGDRVKRIATKLDVASVDPTDFMAKVLKASPIQALERAGFKVMKANEWKPEDLKSGDLYGFKIKRAE